MNCRGHETRKQIVHDYNVECIAHIMLLNNQTIHSDAEREIENDYFVFICTHKTTEVKEKIVCGSGAAYDFLKLTNKKAPALFNMLTHANESLLNVGENNESHQHHSFKDNAPSLEKDVPLLWNDAAKQLYNAIMVLIVAWNLKPGKIYDYLVEAQKYHYCKPFFSRVERINQILYRNKTTISKVLASLAKDNPNLREYQFDELTKILSENNVKSFFI